MPLKNLGDVMQLDDPAPDWRWAVEIIGIPGKLPPLNGIFVIDYDFPLATLDSEMKFRGGAYQHFPKYASAYQCTLTFYETQSFIVSSYLNYWTTLVQDDNNFFGVPKDYMSSMILELYDYVGVKRCTLTLDGSWPIRRGSFRGNYESSGKLAVTCEFMVNSPSISFIGGNSDATISNSIIATPSSGNSNNSVVNKNFTGVSGTSQFSPANGPVISV